MHTLFVAASAAFAILACHLVSMPSHAFAGEQVHFHSAETPPTPFQIKRAKAKGIKLHPRPGVLLTGILTRPSGDGPFPAVILLHGCQGIRPYQTAWAERLAEWGYVALQIDSHGPRGISSEACSSIEHYCTAGDQILDAYGAVKFLKTLPFVDARRTAVLGWAHGGYAAIGLTQPDSLGQFFDREFRAVIAFYPGCDRNFDNQTGMPVLVLNGAEDDQSLATTCQAMADIIAKAGGGLELVILDGTLHGFDDPEVGERVLFPNEVNKNNNPTVGVTRGYSTAAEQQAEQKVRDFLAQHLGG